MENIIGLINKGKFSSFNSVIQVFSCNPYLARFFSKGKIEIAKNKFIDSFSLVIRELHAGSFSFVPKTLTETAMERLNLDTSQEQNPIVLLEKILFELHQHLSKYENHEIKNTSSTHYKLAKKEFDIVTKCKTSIISKLFLAQSIVKVRCCKCLNQTTIYPCYLKINCNLGSNETVNINTSLKSRFTIDYTNKACQICEPDLESSIDESIIDENIFVLPEMLIVNFDRFNHQNIKNKAKLTNYSEIDLGDYIYSNSDESTRYSIQSIICSSGESCEDSKYYTLTFDNLNVFKFDNEKVSQSPKINPDEFIILIYKKI